MKYVSSILLTAFLICSISLVGQNRYTRLEFSKLGQVKTPDLESTLETLDKVYRAKYERAMQECYSLVIDGLREAVLEGNGDFDFIEPEESSWIQRIEYYHSHTMMIEEYSKACLLFTKDGSHYLYRIDDYTWEKWKKAYSKGRFFNQNIRDNKAFSFRPFCDVFIERK